MNKPMSQLSPALAARLSVPDGQNDQRRGGSDYSKLRGVIRTQKDQMQVLENENAHYKSRLHRIEDGHRLELARLKKEVEYHKRLRQGADQRSYELEDRLGRLQQQLQRQQQQHQEQQQQAAAASSSAPAPPSPPPHPPHHHPHHDEEKDGLIAQSQLLVAKNSELTTRCRLLESQVLQLEELKAALESELNQAYCERDELAGELERVLTRQHYRNLAAPVGGEGEAEEGEEGASSNGVSSPADSGGDGGSGTAVGGSTGGAASGGGAGDGSGGGGGGAECPADPAASH
ncbi:hypothetical protein Agub_g8440 [Astrephomene gubernaculifera]|uniref:Uncharacterized protein n=1 Tax=Astrephomene gubernaculifera TaxID=47775 RepID=A0AAD3HN32_9CHLO|nr:hypothetical protein Agub_g8440 [Astrephomene gubernaculifera]